MNQDKSDAVCCAIIFHEFKDEGGGAYSQGLGLRTAYERIRDTTLDVSMIISPFHETRVSERAVRNGVRVVVSRKAETVRGMSPDPRPHSTCVPSSPAGSSLDALSLPEISFSEGPRTKPSPWQDNHGPFIRAQTSKDPK